jgi:hypothetical protein
MKREALVDDRDTEHVETSKEKRVGSLFRSHGQPFKYGLRDVL